VTKKITELPAATLVEPADLVAVVDAGPIITKKATLTQVVQGLDGLVATLSGSRFSGPVTASLGVSASHVSLGLLPASTGDLRLSNNSTIKARVGLSDSNVIEISSGDMYFGNQSSVPAARLWGASSAGMAVGTVGWNQSHMHFRFQA